MAVMLNQQQLESGIPHIQESPLTEGTVELIVCRPSVGERQELVEGELDLTLGLKGDNWLERGYRKTADGSAHPDMQLNLMNARAIDLIAGDRSRWSLAGDQFYVDFNLSYDNIPPGTQLQIGQALVEITAEPHLGCKKFINRFGKDAALFVNSELGKSLNLRGVNAKVITPGTVKTGDTIRKV